MKLRLLALALLVCGGAAAQNPYIALQGADETSGGIVVSQPRTVLAVDVTAERDVTLSGPYARYAQKFLGVRAPLTDKISWAVTGASVALLDPKAFSVGMQQLSLDDFVPKALPDAAPAVQKLAARGMAADEAAKTVRQEALQCLTKRM